MSDDEILTAIRQVFEEDVVPELRAIRSALDECVEYFRAQNAESPSGERG
ncbi:MAG: hypothetical protein JSS87_05305 [Acidobacteria bacterium]|nr:hypothetical protein [Acidobacteriota bacterium]